MAGPDANETRRVDQKLESMLSAHAMREAAINTAARERGITGKPPKSDPICQSCFSRESRGHRDGCKVADGTIPNPKRKMRAAPPEDDGQPAQTSPEIAALADAVRTQGEQIAQITNVLAALVPMVQARPKAARKKKVENGAAEPEAAQ